MSDVLYAVIAIAVAIAIAIAVYAFAFPQEDLVHAQIVWATGTVYLILFVVLNFWIERIWFPRPAPNLEPVPPLVGPVRRAHVAFGTVEAVVFIIGIVLIATGTSVMGTRGYGSF